MMTARVALGGLGGGAALLVATGCGAPCGPEVQILDAAKLERVGHCQQLGNIQLSSTDLQVIELPELVELNYLHLLENDALTALHLPALERVHGNRDQNHGIHIDRQPNLATADLGALRDMGTSSLVLHAADLSDLDLGALEVAGSLQLSATTGLQRLILPDVAIRRIEIDHNEALVEVDLGLGPGTQDGQWLEGQFQVEGNATLESLTIRDDLEAGGQINEVLDNPSLQSLDLPDLITAGQLLLNDNTALSTLSAPSIEKLERLQVTGHPSLPDCQAWALVHAVEAAGNPLDNVEIANQPDGCTP